MVSTSNPPSRRRFWIGLGVGVAGCLLVVAIVCIAVLVFGRGLSARLVGDPAKSWADAASQVEVELYEPGYLPPGAGQPRIGIFRPAEGVEEIRVGYPNGITIEESNARTEFTGMATAAATIDIADEAYFVENNSRRLVINLGGTSFGTWIILSGAPDEQLVQIGESLRQVED